MRIDRESATRLGRSAAAVMAALAVATALVAVLEYGFQLSNTSSVYLLAVVAVAISRGTLPALATAGIAFVLHNLLFVEPRFTLTVSRPEEWVTLFLLLVVGAVIGQLAGSQRDRERLALRREREARALFAITRELATASRSQDAIGPVLSRLLSETTMGRMWVGLGATVAQERLAGDTEEATALPPLGTHSVLRRDRAEGSAEWTRLHSDTEPWRAVRAPSGRALYRVELRAGEQTIGSLWSQRDQSLGDPFLEQTRLLAAAADQIAQAVQRDRLATAAAETEIARRSDQLRSALLDSVSHDLRTPLASIRAAAGSIADASIELPLADRRAAAQLIDVEAERLNRLVGSLLDMSRIQGGVLVPDIEVIPLTELVEPLARLTSARGGPAVVIDLPDDLPSVKVDATFLAQALTNLLENAARHAPAGPIAIRARHEGTRVSLSVEDGGPGVPPESLPRIFERFYRSPEAAAGARQGFGLGLAVVRGLVEAMGGSARAQRSDLGGLAVTLDLPAAAEAETER
ncbi:MAG: sensor histidine kinase [Candidatus Limnocylindria bacterium]